MEQDIHAYRNQDQYTYMYGSGGMWLAAKGGILSNLCVILISRIRRLFDPQCKRTIFCVTVEVVL